MAAHLDGVAPPTPPSSWEKVVDVIANVLCFLFPAEVIRLRLVSKPFQQSVDLITSQLFFPFAYVRQGYPTVVGTFSLSRQEVLFTSYAAEMKKRVVVGKAYHGQQTDADAEKVVNGIISSLISTTPKSLAADDSDPSAASNVCRFTRYRLDCPAEGSLPRTCGDKFRPMLFLLSEEYSNRISAVFKKCLADDHQLVRRIFGRSTLIAPSDVAVINISEQHDARLGINGGIAAMLMPSLDRKGDEGWYESPSYKPRTLWIGSASGDDGSWTTASLSRLQLGIHRVLMSFIGGPSHPSASSVVKGYTCTVGRGAVLLTVDQAKELFGQPPSSSLQCFSDDKETPSSWHLQPALAWRQRFFSLTEAADEALISELLGDPSRLQRSVILIRNKAESLLYPTASLSTGENICSHFVRKYPSAVFYVGITPSGLEGVVSAAEFLNCTSPFFHFSTPQIDADKSLYITDNSFFSEVFDEEFCLPTAILRRGLVRRNEGRESGAPTIFGRPLTAPWLLWGGSDTMSSPHVEPFDSSAWVHCFHGRKLWSVFNEDNRRWECFEQHSGDTVLVGQGILHAVLNSSAETFAIAQNFFPL